MKGVRKFTWLFGFMGLLGFRYFTSHDIGDFVWFMFLGFFAFFFIRNVNTEQQDEMYVAHMREASQFVLIVPMLTVFFVAFGAGQWGFSLVALMWMAMVGWVATLMLYAFKLWQLERGT